MRHTSTFPRRVYTKRIRKPVLFRVKMSGVIVGYYCCSIRLRKAESSKQISAAVIS